MSAFPRARTRPRLLDAVLFEAGLGTHGTHATVSGVSHDSRLTQRGDLYVGLPGFVTHGARFGAEAVARGASAVLTDPAGQADCEGLGVPVVVVDDPRSRLGEIAAAVYGRPGDDLVLVAVTGTNGKTTTCQLIAAGMESAGIPAGVIGTAGVSIAGERIPSARTTPEATDLHALLALMRERGVRAVAMEVSSHALVLGRVGGLRFDVVGFTNLTMDHLDFHGTMESYFEAKASLFARGRARRGVVCIDDDYGRRLASSAGIPVSTASMDPGASADYTAEVVTVRDDGSQVLRITGRQGLDLGLAVGLPGRFNASNTLLACAILDLLDLVPAAGAFDAVRVPGRMETVSRAGGRTCLVDYAHSPDAVERVLSEVRRFGSGRLISVLGCGGDRDRDKRPVMGRVAAELSDTLVVTDDNPRTEDPAAIRAEMLAGATGCPAEIVEIGDRREAIRWAVAAARPGDVVVILGKGHEQGQEIRGVVHPFDDRDEVTAALEKVRA